jgi:hypothetical protein
LKWLVHYKLLRHRCELLHHRHCELLRQRYHP